MTARAFLRAALCLLCLVATSSMVSAETAAPAEKVKIEGLITHVEGLKDASFIRNGSSYDAKTAGKFLRGKWQAQDKEIKTAADFIAKAATVSSTSGKPYLIRFKDGSEVHCADYLTAQLKKVDAGSR